MCLPWGECAAVPKPHVITFGKWISAKWPNATGQKLLDLKVRPLFVDTRLKEYTTGIPHELTDRLFVVRRAFRVNDALPTEKPNSDATHWQWQRGGWLLVDRLTGRVSQLNLPEFDPFYSTASWYRDYIAYCGRLRGRQETVLGRGPGRTPQAHPEKRRRRTRGSRRSRLGVPAPRLGAHPYARHLSARRQAEARLLHPRARCRRGQRHRRAGRISAAQGERLPKKAA